MPLQEVFIVLRCTKRALLSESVVYFNILNDDQLAISEAGTY